MKHITLQIEDSKLPFFMELIHNFDFIKITETDAKKEIIDNIKQGLVELTLVEQGKLKSRPAEELLHEL